MSDVVECCSADGSPLDSSLHKSSETNRFSRSVAASRLRTLLPRSPLRCANSKNGEASLFLDLTSPNSAVPLPLSTATPSEAPSSPSQWNASLQRGSNARLEANLHITSSSIRRATIPSCSPTNYEGIEGGKGCQQLGQHSQLACVIHDNARLSQSTQEQQSQLLSDVVNRNLLEYIALDIPLQLGMGSPYSSSCTILFSS